MGHAPARYSPRRDRVSLLFYQQDCAFSHCYSAPPPGKHGFRPEIKGLRALTVLPILLSYAKIKGFGGGFVDSDISFDISGFLITGIVLRDLAHGRFSFAGLYRRRILRLTPALFATLITCACIAQ